MPDKYDLMDSAQERCLKGIRFLDRALSGHTVADVELVGISIRGPKGENEEFLITVRGLGSDGQALVAWHSASSLWDLIAGVATRLGNGSLKWKPDEWGR